jgi:hypothetical protein
MIRGVVRIGMLVGLGVAIVASVTAQEPSSRAPVQSPDKDKVVVIGCLQRAAQLPVGTTGAVGDADVSKFILMKVASPSDSQPTAASRTYRLDADDSLLTTHVGHKVEITGTLDSAKPSASVTGDPAPPAAAGASKLKVTSVKMIAAACE